MQYKCSDYVFHNRCHPEVQSESSQILSQVTEPSWSIVTNVIPGHLAFDERQLVCQLLHVQA